MISGVKTIVFQVHFDIEEEHDRNEDASQFVPVKKSEEPAANREGQPHVVLNCSGVLRTTVQRSC